MIKNLKKLLVMLIFASIVVSCGSDSGGGGGANPDASSTGGGQFLEGKKWHASQGFGTWQNWPQNPSGFKVSFTNNDTVMTITLSSNYRDYATGPVCNDGGIIVYSLSDEINPPSDIFNYTISNSPNYTGNGIEPGQVKIKKATFVSETNINTSNCGWGNYYNVRYFQIKTLSNNGGIIIHDYNPDLQGGGFLFMQ